VLPFTPKGPATDFTFPVKSQSPRLPFESLHRPLDGTSPARRGKGPRNGQRWLGSVERTQSSMNRGYYEASNPRWRRQESHLGTGRRCPALHPRTPYSVPKVSSTQSQSTKPVRDTAYYTESTRTDVAGQVRGSQLTKPTNLHIPLAYGRLVFTWLSSPPIC